MNNQRRIMRLAFTGLLILAAFVCMAHAQDNKNDPQWLPRHSKKGAEQTSYRGLPYKNDRQTTSQTTAVNIIKTKDGTTILVPASYRPFPSAVTESGVAVVTQGGNQSFMFAAWNSILLPSTFYETGWAWTSNSGITWTGNVSTVPNIGDPGPWVWSTNSSYSGRLGMSYLTVDQQIGATYSTDGGTTWAANFTFPGTSANCDKNFSTVDDVTGSAFLGRAYTVYTDFGSANANRICISYSTNGGVSWSAEAPVSPVSLSGHHCQGCDCVVGPGGVLYVCWAYCLTNGANSTEQDLGFAKSTDGGVTWITSTNTAVPTNGIRTSNLLNGCKANGFPRIAVDKSGGARNGYVYCTMCEKNIAPARDNADCTFMRSTDGGTTWTHTLVNGDTAGPLQWHSAITVDQTNGNVAIGYYDQRNTAATDAEYFVSFSTNGGNNWTDVQASDHSWTVDYIHSPSIAAGYMGDYSGINWGNGKFYPFWNDPSINPSASLQQVWTCGINTVAFTHDFAGGPFLSLPVAPVVINTPYTIKAKIQNEGTSAETSVPVKFFVDGVLINTTNVSENAGQTDSVSNIWQTPVAGNHLLMYVTALATDQDRSNDTVRTTINVIASLPPICEQFLSATFPPANWTQTEGLWGYNSVSGFCYGTGSAQADFYDVTSGTFDLNTPNFPASHTGDSLIFQDAYASYMGEDDQLQVMTSSDGGTTYTELALLHGGASGELVTAPPTTDIFSPTCTQWKYQRFLLPAGTNKLQFNGISAFGNQLYIDSICISSEVIGILSNNTLTPKTYSLSQNYPNPFNPSTSIEYGLPKAGVVKLVIYDILGRVVSTLLNEYKQAGSYRISFNAANLASGVYFYRVESGDFSAVKKMLLIK